VPYLPESVKLYKHSQWTAGAGTPHVDLDADGARGAGDKIAANSYFRSVVFNKYFLYLLIAGCFQFNQ